jgi:hypothetical protein
MFVNGSPGPASAPAPSSSLGDRLADLPLELIEREIESLAAQINAGCARWLELVAEFDRREGWGGTGCRTTCEWVAWRCALTPRSAREHVRVARALPGLPLIRESFGRGELSYSKVRALSRLADADSEAELVELARHATAAQLERMVRAARRCTAAEADEQHRARYLRWYWDEDDGCLHIDAKLPPEDGALFLGALEAAATPCMSSAQPRPTTPRPTETVPRSRLLPPRRAAPWSRLTITAAVPRNRLALPRLHPSPPGTRTPIVAAPPPTSSP